MSSSDDSFVVPMHQRLKERGRHQIHRLVTAIKMGFQLYRTTLRAFFFPDTFQFYTGTLVRSLFALYYIPFLAIVLALTHSALQRVVWVLIIPIAQDMERNPYNYSYWATFLYGVSTIIVRILPFAALGLSVLTVGYKVQHCVGEAMMDAFVRHDGEDYPLLHARIRFMREDRTRERILLVVLSIALGMVGVLLHTNAVVSWTMSGERSTLVRAAWGIILVEACFVALTAVAGAPKEMMEDQWNTIVSPIRRALTAPSSLDVAALADGDASSPLAVPTAASSLASSSSGPSSPYTPGGTGTRAGDRTSRPRRRREPYWRPRVQAAGEAASAGGGDRESSVGNSSLAEMRMSATSTLSPLRGTAGAAVDGDVSPTRSAAQTSATQPAGVLRTPLSASSQIHDWRRHSTSDATLAPVHTSHVSLSSARPESHTSTNNNNNSNSWDTSLHTSLASSQDDAALYRHGSSRNSRASDESRHGSDSSSSDDEEEDTFLDYFQEDWWKENIHKMRYIAIGMVTAVCMITGIRRGLVNGLTIGVLLVMCLNLPHLVGYGTLAVCAAIVRTYRSFAWLRQHSDAFWPFVVTVSPYQVPLCYAIFFFRHHPLTVLLLLGATALLLARGIDLIREFDVTEKGCVHWRDRRSGALLTPSLAALLETAYERAHHRPDLVSLDLVIDIQRMRIYDLRNRTEIPISRTQVFPYGAARRYVRSWDFYSFVVPRLLSLQSPGYFTGSKFRVMRVMLRILMVLLALSVSVITFGILLQAAFPSLRPLPVRVHAAQNGHALVFDHVVIRMHLQAKHGIARAADLPADDDLLYVTDSGVTPCDTVDGLGSAANLIDPIPQSQQPRQDKDERNDDANGDDQEDNSSQVMLKLSNVTSPAGVDFYPQLCVRDYYGTSVWELALLSLAPYLYNIDELTVMLRFMNTHLGSDWELRPRHGRSCRPGPDSSHQPTGWTGYFEVHSASRNTSVIAVRGTDLFSFTDFLIDMNLFFEPVLFQVLANVIPGARLIPKELVVDAIHAASLSEVLTVETEEPLQSWDELQTSTNHSLRRCRPNNYMRNFFADVENHLAYIGSRPGRPKHVILTGHSMGGAVAAIVASKMGVQAVAFSAPGIVSARKKFGVELMALHQRVVTVASSNDIVPQMGAQGGEVQHLECLAERRELCHAMEFMVGTLWRSCSAVRQRFPNLDDIV